MRETEVKKLLGRKDRKQVSDNNLVARGNTDGTVSWCMVFYSKGVLKRYTFGSYPELPLDEAQERAITYRRKWKEEGLLPKEYEELRAEELEQKRKQTETEAITLRDLLDKYEMSRRGFGRGDSERTLKDLRNTVLSMWEPFLDKPIQKITSQELLETFFLWTSQRKSPQTGKPAIQQARKGVRYIKAMFNYAIDSLEILDRNPANKVTAQVKTKSEEREYWLTTSECHQLYEHLYFLSNKQKQKEFIKSGKFKENDFTEERQIQYDAITLYLLTGLRQHEILDMPWADVYLDKYEYEGMGSKGAYFRITTSKQKKPFGVPITDEMRIVFERRKKNKRNDYVFPSLKEGFENTHIGDDRTSFAVLNRHSPKLKNTTKLTANVLRHTFATACYSHYKDMDRVDRMTGHLTGGKSSRLATPVYVHMQADDHREWFKTTNALLCNTGDNGSNWDDFSLREDSEEMQEMEVEEQITIEATGKLEKKLKYYEDNPDKLTKAIEKQLKEEEVFVTYLQDSLKAKMQSVIGRLEKGLEQKNEIIKDLETKVEEANKELGEFDLVKKKEKLKKEYIKNQEVSGS